MWILVIEDEDDVRHNILEILDSGGFEAIGVADGYSGLQLVREKSPGLILCDIRMPDLDGYSILSEVRCNPETALIPFIFLTAKVDKADIRQGMNSGADDYLTKPFRRVELLETIVARLDKHSTVANVQQKLQEFQQLNVQKDALVSAVAHDLRAPLTTIQLALQLLDVASEDERQYFLNVALAACEQGDDLIQNLLDLHRLEAGDELFVLQAINVSDFILELIPCFQVRMCDRQQQFTLELPKDLPELISDGVSLKRILTELLNNACKYTPVKGEIRVQVQHAINPDQIPIVRFVIQNQAEIPAAEVPHIFEKFYRVSRGPCSEQVGSGLGLPLVKKLVDHLQGALQVTSCNGWTTFSVELPLTVQCLRL